MLYIYMTNYIGSLCFMSEQTILACEVIADKEQCLFTFWMCHVETQTTNFWASFLVMLPMTVKMVMDDIPEQQKTVFLRKEIDLQFDSEESPLKITPYYKCRLFRKWNFFFFFLVVLFILPPRDLAPTAVNILGQISFLFFYTYFYVVELKLQM